MGITVVNNWQLVSVIGEDKDLVGVVLYADVLDDSTCRFTRGDYVCTSQITRVDLDLNIVETHSGSIYQPMGVGINSYVRIEDFELLREGHTPQEINLLKNIPNSYFH